MKTNYGDLHQESFPEGPQEEESLKNKILIRLREIYETYFSMEVAGEIIFLVAIMICLVLMSYTNILQLVPTPIKLLLALSVLMTIGMLYSSIKRAVKFSRSNRVQITKTGQVKMVFPPGEKITALIPGIMRIDSDMRFNATPINDSGEIKYPENAIIVTNGHVMVVCVMSADNGSTIGSEEGISQDPKEQLLRYLEIKGSLEGMAGSMTLQQIYDSCPKNFAIETGRLAAVKFGTFQPVMTLTTKDHKKYMYAFREKAAYNQARNVFRNYGDSFSITRY